MCARERGCREHKPSSLFSRARTEISWNALNEPLRASRARFCGAGSPCALPKGRATPRLRATWPSPRIPSASAHERFEHSARPIVHRRGGLAVYLRRCGDPSTSLYVRDVQPIVLLLVDDRGDNVYLEMLHHEAD